MSFNVRNAATAANAEHVNVLGLRALARARTSLTAAVEASDTSLVVNDARMFRVGDAVIVGSGDDEETVTVAAVDLETNTLSVSAVSAGHDVGTRVVAPWHDFGHVRNPAREQELTELDIQSARNGRLATVKKITTAQTLEFTFESISVFDRDTIAWHTGGAVADGVIGSGAVMAVEEFTGAECEFLFVQENAETNGKVKLAYYPKAQVKGDGEESGDGESEAALNFRVTVLEDEEYTVPATLDANENAAPYGFRYIVPAANRDAALDAISGGGAGS